MEYDHEEFQMIVNDERYDLDDLDELFEKFQDVNVIIDCTTLGFAEILYSIKLLKSSSARKYLLYLEPGDYRRSDSKSLLHKREYDLSNTIYGFKGIPGFIIRLTDKDPQVGAFFLGFESSRLDRAFEEFQMFQPSKCSVIFGVPAFKAGWEMNSFANNIRVIKEKNISGGVHFSGANNPKAAIDRLEKIYKGLDTGERLFIAPLGSKPTSIGVAIFLNNYSNTGVVYDHPKAKEERSESILHWNLYEML
jgi:hypothetical protein